MKYMRYVAVVAMALFLGTDIAPAQVTPFAGGFKGPENITFDGKGGLYVTDTDHLYKVSPDGKSTALYTRDPKIDGASICGVTIGPEGKVYFSASNRILIYNPADNSVTELVKGFKLANGICVDDKGNLFIADSGKRIIFVVPAGAKQAVILKKIGGMVNGVKWDRKDNTLYYTVSFPSKLAGLKLDDKLNIVKSFTVTRSHFVFYDDFAMDADGNFYVCMWKGGKIIKVTPDGRKQVVVKGLDGPSAVAFGVGDASGKLFVCIKGATFKFKGTQLVTIKMEATGYRLPFLP